ncbi:related to MUC1 Extracellular alpha-1,4-glucan glucosidase [Phialocephala subalpina]|uniref:Related to MUC1 Extracellular alpha-1,4-glucan glucosidase n=1 Tax=Phialocephala subalpina TaxID=576137 RepID=A0A1L7WDQ5_9HELO|nr:related to MUC1 Extracellular alpha-1,4-glucan glucosidase [Phialocephala subalpina]
MTTFRDVGSDSHLLTARPTLSGSFNDLRNASTDSFSTSDNDQRKPRARKPSPGLAARLKALGFGKDTNKSSSRSPSNDQIGRIPEDKLHKLDSSHLANSTTTPSIQPRGRAWSGASGYLTPQPTGGSFTESIASEIRILEGGTRRTPSVSSGDRAMTTHAEDVDMDSQKYRLPEHTNGNGTKALSDTKQAHFERDVPPDDETPPPPLAKDTPPGGTTPAEFNGDAQSYFNPFGLQRAGSIYTLSRVSFASQLAQLTSLQLPDAESLSTKVSAIPTSKTASKALMGAAEQIRSWISKASEVIAGLDGEDDVEWAAAGGREGLAEVDNAITRFEELINVYVSAIESLQSRADIATVPADELKKVVLQVETILAEWEKIKKTLKAVKNSVEIAMEWEELWDTVLGDIGNEMDVLARLVFEMEEKRHKSLMAETGGEGGLDINELETIVEETPPSKTRLHANNRFSVPASFPLSPSSPNPATMVQDDSSLLALFARMQPLRASLDFLPMRLSTFHYRAEKIFPSACEELETRRDGLESSWKKLEKDAESLRRELGEDRWVLVFRGAGRQAQKMYESVERSVTKLKEAVDAGAHLQNPASMGKKIESYEAKKIHYGPAIERVLSIIERGVKDRLTVNGEILRLHSEMQRKWEALKEQMAELDQNLDEIQADKKNQQLRDSISSMLSNDRSTVGSLYDTPGSSPASSVVMTGLTGPEQMAPIQNGKVRSNSKSSLPKPGARRNVSMPSSTSQLPRKGANRLSTITAPAPQASPSPGSSRQGSATPTGNRLPRPSLTHMPDGRPRWNSSVNTQGTIIGHNFKPLSLTTPSPHARTNKPPSAHQNRPSESKIPLRSPLSRDNTASPAPQVTPSRTSNSRLALRDRIASPGPYSQEVLSKSSPATRPRLATQSSMSALTSSSTNRRASFQPKSSDPTSFGSPLSKPVRPASSMAGNRRVSLLPQPRGRQASGVTGRESPQAIAGAASAMRANSGASSNKSNNENKPAFKV